MINTLPERIAYTDNTSNGINILAQSINWKRGDRILLNDIEFPANVYPFLNLKRIGVEVDYVKSDNGIVSSEMIIDAVKPGTKKPFDIKIYNIAMQDAFSKFFKKQVPYFFKNIQPVMKKAPEWWKKQKQDEQIAYVGWVTGHLLMLIGIILLIVL